MTDGAGGIQAPWTVGLGRAGLALSLPIPCLNQGLGPVYRMRPRAVARLTSAPIAPIRASSGGVPISGRIPPIGPDASLVLQARYGSGTEVEVACVRAYQVGASSRREPLVFDDRAAGFRDPHAAVYCCEAGFDVFRC